MIWTAKAKLEEMYGHIRYIDIVEESSGIYIRFIHNSTIHLALVKYGTAIQIYKLERTEEL